MLWETYKKTMEAPPSLWNAAKANDVAQIARLLADGCDIDERDVRGFAPLMLAAYNGCEEAFEYLLERGADPNTADNAGNSVLMGAAFKGNVAFVKRLLRAGADRTARNHTGLDARGFALAFGRTEVVQLFDSL